jgi:hypothetical protein
MMRRRRRRRRRSFCAMATSSHMTNGLDSLL